MLCLTFRVVTTCNFNLIYNNDIVTYLYTFFFLFRRPLSFVFN